jgi:hypothetical protein
MTRRVRAQEHDGISYEQHHGIFCPDAHTTDDSPTPISL